MLTCLLPLSLVPLSLPLSSAATPLSPPSSPPWASDDHCYIISLHELTSNLCCCCWAVGMPSSYSMFHSFDRVPTINGQQSGWAQPPVPAVASMIAGLCPTPTQYAAPSSIRSLRHTQQGESAYTDCKLSRYVTSPVAYLDLRLRHVIAGTTAS